MSTTKSERANTRFRRYWQRVFERAYRDARSFLGHSWKKTILGACILFFAAAGFWWVEGVQKAVGKLEWWGLGFLAEFVVLLLTLPIFLLRAPWLLEKETMDQFKDMLEDHQAQLDEFRNQIARLEARESARLREAANTNKKAIAHARLNKLRQRLSVLIAERKASYPMSGGRYELETMERKHAQETKDMLAAWVIEARKEASEVSLNGYLPEQSELDSVQPERFQVERFAQRLQEGIEAIVGKLA